MDQTSSLEPEPEEASLWINYVPSYDQQAIETTYEALRNSGVSHALATEALRDFYFGLLESDRTSYTWYVEAIEDLTKETKKQM